VTLQGAGSTEGTGNGLGTYTYSYSLPSSNSDGFNSWKYKTVETLPDGNTNTVYGNYAGEVMLTVYHDTTANANWISYFQYDSNGRLVLQANPSAVTGYDETYADLLHSVSGNYAYLADSAGLVTTTGYYSSTTATSTTAGGVAGYMDQTAIQRGETGTSVPQETLDYIARTGGSVTIYPVADSTVYRNTDGTGGETTSTAYTWFSGTVRPQSIQVTYPTVTTAENGPNSADVVTTFYDVYGRPIWTKDADGFLTYTEYDQPTGAVSKRIVDVNTSNTSDFTNLPSGWSTPTGGGLHLITTMEVDALGRTTKLTDPAGDVTYTVYNDTNYEVRVYPGWQSGSSTTTGPTQVYREDRTNSYLETLTMSATPHVTSSRPDGTEAIGSLQTLARSYTDNAGQTVRTDAYFNLSGVTYATSTYIGTLNTNYYKTLFDYDSRGRLDRTLMPTGTINRTVYDGLGRVVSTWVGTDDTPSSGNWSPTNNTSPSNMVQITGNQYDGNGVGDSTLTQITQIPGVSAANRVNQFYYDWRDRLVASKRGVEGTESTSLNRPIFYTDYDNLNEPTAQSKYDGDNVTISFTSGVPDKPSSSLLRAYSTTSYDERGRVYETNTYGVDPSSGSVSTYALHADFWYNHRGELIKSAAPGGLVTKNLYDGAGRLTTTYTTDGGSDSSWSDAGTVTGDAVLTQTTNTYDANGNVLLSTAKDRFDDETATGALGDATTSPKARVSYMAYYYDAVNRKTADVNVGTNGGSSYTRPSSEPSRSDTVLVTDYGHNAAGWLETTTDPRAIVSKTYYDNLGRTTKTIEDYTDGTPTDSSNKTTEFTFDGDGHMLTLKADLPSSAYEETQWNYGVTTSSSGVNSNDILASMEYPDPSTGAPSTSQEETYTVNALGDRTTFTDRNGNVHTYSYDVVGRQTTDAVTTLGSGVDGAVRRLETAYDSAGHPYLFTSYNAASSGSVVNQVQQAYNGLGQLTTEYQEHSGAVNTSTTLKVQYGYNEMASGANNSRPTSMTYPNGRTLNYTYATGLDTTISRLSSITDSGTTLESYKYLGQSTVVERDHPQTNVNQTFISQTSSTGDAGDKYTGLDRFGRVVEQAWYNTSTSSSTDDFLYGYDRDGNVLYRVNNLNHSFDELYHANGASNGYDNLNQLQAFARGTLSDTNSDGIPDTVATASRSQSWSFDALGNWSSVTSDSTTQNRTANKQNEITSITSLTTPTYDSNGNMTGDENGKTLVYDAWNRLVAYKNGGTTLASYSYDALGRRIVQTESSTTTDLYYSSQWQVLEERVGGAAKAQYVWSPVYVNAMIERDRDADGNSSNGLEERLYAQTDANWDVTALVGTAGTVAERYVSDPFGAVTYLTGSWGSLSSSAYAWKYLFQGGALDTATGLYVFQHRDYSPALGRWTSQDPRGYSAADTNLLGVTARPL
jgi:RHS repeat-associated protein